MTESPKQTSSLHEDIAYTLNHAIACTATDFIDPLVGNFTQKLIQKNFSASGSNTSEEKDNLGKWWIGEVAGDFGAVPIVVLAQRLFPNLMNNSAGMIFL